MSPTSTPARLALASVLAVACLGVVGIYIEPESARQWTFRILMLPTLWGFLELAQHRGEDGGPAAEIMNWHRVVIAGMGLMTVVDLGFHLLISTELLGAHWDRISQSLQGVFFGAALTIWGNLLPTVPSPWSFRTQPFAWQRVHRFVGWVATLCGIALVIVWLLLPVEEARLASARILGVFLVLGLGRKLVSVVSHAATQPALM